MQIGAKNRPEMMQIGVEIASKWCKSVLILKGAEFMQIRWEPTAQAAKKLSSDALLPFSMT